MAFLPLSSPVSDDTDAGCCGPGFADRLGIGRVDLLARAAWSRGRLACTAVAATVAGGRPGQAAPDYAPLREGIAFQKLGDLDVYYAIGHSGVPDQENQGHTSNAGFVVTSEGVVVFDALGTPSLGWALLQKIRSVTDQPIRFVVVSHYHADHIYGLQAFRDHTDAAIIAQDRAREYTAPGSSDDEVADLRLAQRRSALGPWVDAATRIVDPLLTFKQQTEISLGGKRFVMLYAGPAHSTNDTMMLVQPDNVLFVGDIIQNGRLPFMASAAVDTANWLHALQAIGDLKPRFLLPGHGELSADAGGAIAFTRGYIAYVRDAMGRAVADWTEFDEAYRRTDWSQFRGIPTFDAVNRGNAYRVYLELQNALAAAPAQGVPGKN